MTRIMRCDVCDTEFDAGVTEIFWAEFKLPPSWLPLHAEERDDFLSLDICSLDCLIELTKALSQEETESDEPADNESRQEPMSLPDVTVR